MELRRQRMEEMKKMETERKQRNMEMDREIAQARAQINQQKKR